MIAINFANYSPSLTRKVFVPVSAMEVKYAQFSHVSGYEEKNVSANSLSKAFILNTLIEKISSVKPADRFSDDISTKQYDAEVTQIHEKISQRMQKVEFQQLADIQKISPGLVFDMAV